MTNNLSTATWEMMLFPHFLRNKNNNTGSFEQPISFEYRSGFICKRRLSL